MFFEAQRNRSGTRRCGAAALVMVYRSFGLNIEQENIWNAIQSRDGHGAFRITTHQMAVDVLRRGLAALPVRLRDPWSFLRSVAAQRELGIRVILNYRLRTDSFLGHYGVFVDFNERDNSVRIHDPQFGPDRRMTKTELLELWQPINRGDKIRNEITGNVVLLVAANDESRELCAKCNNSYCSGPFRPFFATHFDTVFCPCCDSVTPFNAE